MKKTKMKIFIGNLIVLLLITLSGFAQDVNIPAFPGAEGSGKYVTGGRGGQVIYVTTLEDNTSKGSLRYAINQSGARLIIFNVSGTIKLKSTLSISKPDLTIAGQTAPGDGITLRDYSVEIKTDNVIVRFIRFRMGDVTAQENDAFWGRRHKKIMIDHCSLSWSTDECGSFYDNEEFTLQWSIFSESLRNSVHGKGKHGYGGIWGGRGVTFHHNLLANHDSRNPRFCGSRYSNKPDEELVDYRNNVIYNWGGNSAYAAEGGRYNMVNNYYKAGPATSSNQDRIIKPWADDGSNNQPLGTYGTFFIDGNFVTASSIVTNDNWKGVDMSSSFSTRAPGVTLSDLKSETAYPFVPVTTHSAEKAYEKVLTYCGASLKRDSVDLRIIGDVSKGIATFMDGGNGSTNGLIDSQNAVGAWPALQSLNAPTDTDLDGMPDDWENANNLDPTTPSDAQLKSVDGLYPNIEVYINSLVNAIVVSQNEGGESTAIKVIPASKNTLEAHWNNASKELIINHTQPIKSVYVSTISGALIFQKEMYTTSLRTQLGNLKKGVYLVKILDDNNQVFSDKILYF
jgi:pectate lyase